MSQQTPDKNGEQIGWLCHAANGARHFIWKDENEQEEKAWLDKRYLRREPVYVAAPSTTGDTRLEDALDDVKRLHAEKMKFFERTIELERELAAIGAECDYWHTRADDAEDELSDPSTSSSAINAPDLKKPPCDVPEGWRLVPAEPNEEMMQEGCNNLPISPAGCTRQRAGDVYRAMLEVAPYAT